MHGKCSKSKAEILNRNLNKMQNAIRKFMYSHFIDMFCIWIIFLNSAVQLQFESMMFGDILPRHIKRTLFSV